MAVLDNRTKAKKYYLLICLSILVPLSMPQQAMAACEQCSQPVRQEESDQWTSGGDVGASAGTFNRLRRHNMTERTAMQVWTVSIFWEDNLLPALMLMTEQLSVVAMKQAQIIGSFMDAKHQLETQQIFQKMAARSHKDYHPSTGMCEFGSSAKSLAASERKSELTSMVLARRSQNRALGNSNTAGVTADTDKESRLRQFRTKFCDPRDNNDGLSFMCEHDEDSVLTNSTLGGEPSADGYSGRGIGAPTGPPPGSPTAPPRDARKNKDIDFVRTIDFPWTLNIDFVTTATDPVTRTVPASTLTNEEEEVLALASNLYGQEIMVRSDPGALQTTEPGQQPNPAQIAYMDARALMAKRSVAENSFNAIASMKSAGTPGSHDYLLAIMEQFLPPPPPPPPPGSSVPVDPNSPRNRAMRDIEQMLGPNPSYYAQMEILTKKMFQNPDFFTNLYDTPANVGRKGVAIQAIGLMQKFDLYKSYLRNEASLSVLLELAIQDLQEEVESTLDTSGGQGPTDTGK
jgi:hypothetical protein